MKFDDYISNGSCIFYVHNVQTACDTACGFLCGSEFFCEGFISSATSNISTCMFCYDKVILNELLSQITADPWNGSDCLLYEKPKFYFDNEIYTSASYKTMSARFTIQLTFKPDASHGLLILLHNIDLLDDWALLHLNEGYITFSFNTGSGIQNISNISCRSYG